MQIPAALNTGPFLNRMAMEEIKNTDPIDPFHILHDITGYATLPETLGRFQSFCAAALDEKYAWTQGEPGNLLHVSETLELLIEVCFMIHNHPHSSNREFIKNNRRQHKMRFSVPMQVSAKEGYHPLDVVNNFFSFNTLPQWKLALNNWTQAGLSSYSITDTTAPLQVFHFYHNVNGLIEAAYYMERQGSVIGGFGIRSPLNGQIKVY